MNKVFFLAVTNHIAANVSQIKWVDADEGQLNVACRPPVAFPACLVDISYPQCESLSGGVQRIRARVELRVVFAIQGSTNAAAPASVRERSLARFDVLEALHKALQWWNGGGLFNPLKRISSTPERRADDLKVYRVVYETEFFD
ncbi:hypothetical protein [Prevotella pallens]|uniref:hypothetical protein n=1 Tax=Prevotella pallens TaxID=60133 RepID=UPI001CB133F8|nr:hypothetical protein [Prevotella pallens]MBF1475527.1 hypothetical protein [Prevotella pallens]